MYFHCKKKKKNQQLIQLEARMTTLKVILAITR